MTTLSTLSLTLILLLPTAGCDLADAVDFDRSADSALDGRAEAPEHARPHAPPPVMLVELAVQLGELYDEPDMADALASMEADHDAARAAHDALRGALARMAGERSVSVDAVATELAAIETTAEAEGDSMTSALDVAHDLLDAELRAEAVDMLPEPPPPPPEAGAQPPSDQDQPDGSGHRPPPMEPLLHALELDEDQHEALRTALGDPPAPDHEPLDLASFVDEDFEAGALGLADAHAARVTEHATRSVEMISVLAELLDDEQLETLVDLLEAELDEPSRTAPV